MKNWPVFALGLCAGLMLAAAFGLARPGAQAEPTAAPAQVAVALAEIQSVAAPQIVAQPQSAAVPKATLSWEFATAPAPPPEDGKLRIIQFGAHPDDCEIRAGGCGAMWSKLGHHVKFVSVTNGDIGHWQMAGGPLALRRTAEAIKAAEILGVTTEVLPIHDGELEPTLEYRRLVTRLIRAWNADIVISHRPNDYHPDHRYVGVLVQDSAYMVAVPFFCPEVPPLKKNPVFLFSYDTFQRPNPFRPDIVVAIDEVIEQKLDALLAMPSQFIEGGALGNASMVPRNAEEMEKRTQQVRDSFKRRFANIADRCRQKLIELYGEEAGNKVRYAEAFEICEYGRQPSPAEIRQLFPFLPKK